MDPPFFLINILAVGCDHQNIQETEKIFKNGSKHIETRCADCGTFKGWKINDTYNPDFVWPVGTYRGCYLTDLSAQYLEWAAENLTQPNLVRRALQELEIRDTKFVEKYLNE